MPRKNIFENRLQVTRYGLLDRSSPHKIKLLLSLDLSLIETMEPSNLFLIKTLLEALRCLILCRMTDFKVN